MWVDKIIYFIKKNILKYKKNNTDKIIYYLSNKEIFFKFGFNNLTTINIEYDSIMDLIKNCENIISFNKHHNPLMLNKIPESINISSLELFFNFDGKYIENKEKINELLLLKILEVYKIDNGFKENKYLFFSKTLQPHIIILEKYLKVLFNL